MQSQEQGQQRANKGRRALVLLILAVMIAGAGAYWLARPVAAKKDPGNTPQATLRSRRTWTGPLERTIRLSGATAPERFAALLVPMMRGARASLNSSLVGGARKAPSSAPSRASQVSSTVNVGSNVSGSLGTALNRFSLPSSGGSSSSSSGSSSSSASSSTSGGGGGGGGGFGGRGGDFELTLQKLVAPGSRVKKGDIVAEFDRQNMLLRLDDFRAVANQIEASLATLKVTLEVEKKAHSQSIDLAKATVERARYDLKTVPVQAELDAEKLRLAEQEAAANYKLLQTEVKFKDLSQQAEWRVAELERDQFAVELKRAEVNADRMLVKAPLDGITVMSTTFRGGETGQIRAGDTLHPGMPFVRIVEPASMVVNATVNQVDIEKLRVGARAKVRFDAYPDLELPGRVYSVAAIPKTGGFRATYVKEVPVVIKLDRMDARVIPDLSVSADVVIAEEPQAVLAPAEAVFTEGGKPCVFVWNGKAWERREVELGLVGNIVAAVRSGLQSGELIALERPRVEANQ